MPRSVQGCFFGTAFDSKALSKKLSFCPAPKKKRDAFPRFFLGIAGAKE
jgi:hypothetical protein